MGTALRTAHYQDFEKKKKPELGDTVAKDDDSDDDEDADDDRETESGDASENASRAEDRDDIEQVRQEVAIGRAGPAN